MQAILRRGDAATLPRSPRKSVRSTIAVRWRRLAGRLYRLAEQLPSSPRELPPEWFRYPLP